MLDLTLNARRLINQRLPIEHRELYLRWLDNACLSECDRLEVLDRICNVLRVKDQPQFTYHTISEYESWLIRNGLAKRRAVLAVNREKHVPANRIWDGWYLAKLGQLLNDGVAVDEIADRLRVTKTQVRAAMQHYADIIQT